MDQPLIQGVVVKFKGILSGTFPAVHKRDITVVEDVIRDFTILHQIPDFNDTAIPPTPWSDGKDTVMNFYAGEPAAHAFDALTIGAAFINIQVIEFGAVKAVNVDRTPAVAAACRSRVV